MKTCDIVVIGAGPTGCYAAKEAAQRGARVVILEEHPAVGLPRHGVGWLIGAEFTEKLVERIKGQIPIQPVVAFNYYDASTGETLDEVRDVGGYLIHRDILDKAVARLAVAAGADLFVNTKAIELIREEGKVVGVRTGSRWLAEVRCAVVLCADGIRSISNGFARANLPGIVEDTEEFRYQQRVEMELVGVADTQPGVMEKYAGAEEVAVAGQLWPHSEASCYAGFASLEEFHRIKAEPDNTYKRKFKAAFPIHITGFSARTHAGKLLERCTDNGIVFIGDAGGGSGIIHGMISGLYAARVAVEAAREGQTGQDRLREYEILLRGSDIVKYPFYWGFVQEFYGSYRNCLMRFREISVGI